MELNDPIATIPFLGPLLMALVPYAPIWVAGCSALATRLPPPEPAAGWAYCGLYAVVNFCAFNFHHAKNEGSK